VRQLRVQNCYTTFRENKTNGLVTDTRSQMDGRTDGHGLHTQGVHLNFVRNVSKLHLPQRVCLHAQYIYVPCASYNTQHSSTGLSIESLLCWTESLYAFPKNKRRILCRKTVVDIFVRIIRNTNSLFGKMRLLLLQLLAQVRTTGRVSARCSKGHPQVHQ
jgi:hypothetical protein